MGKEQKVICHTQQELDMAYKNLSQNEGGEILLASGVDFQFRAWDLDQSQDEAAVTFRSLDPGSPATLETVAIHGIDNVTFEGLYMHLAHDAPKAASGMISVTNSNNITFQSCEMEGDAKGAPGTIDGFEAAANAAVIRDSQNVTFKDNVISKFYQGLAFLDSRDVTVSNNDITALQGDGIRIGGVSGMEISGNHIHDFIGSTQDFNHTDFIQIWGANITVNNENIEIRENILDTGNGAAYQMIFGYNDHASKNGLTFTNIQIEDNLLFGAHYHSISLNDTQDTVVRNNTILTNENAYIIHNDGSQTLSTMVGAIDIGGEGAIVENNIAPIIQNPGNNVILGRDDTPEQDPSVHFVNLEAAGDGDLRDLSLRPDSPLNGQAGSSLTWARSTAENLTAVADVTVSNLDHSFVTLSGELSYGPDGYAHEDGAKFTWVFEGGHTLTGAIVEHDFKTAGDHDYVLIATLPDGSRDVITRSIKIAPTQVFDLTFSDPNWTGTSLMGDASVQDRWLEIGGQSGLNIARSTEGMYDLASFNLGITIDRQSGAEGQFLDLPNTFSASIDAEGHVRFILNTDEGEFTLISGEAIFADDQPHKLNFVYNSEAGSLALVVDDKVSDTIEAHGTTASELYWGLTVGRAWGDSLDARVQDVYLLNEDISRDGQPYDIGADDQPNFLGRLFWNADGIEAIDLDYTLSGPGPWTEDGVNISENKLTLTRNNDVFYEADAFSMSFGLQLSDAKDSGTILYLHNTLELSLNEVGQLVFRLKTTEGWEQIATAPLDLGVETNAIGIVYDSSHNTFQILVDNTLAANGEHSGETPEIMYWGVNFGHPWAGTSIDAVVNDITVSSAVTLVEAETAESSAFDWMAPEMSGDILLAFDFEGDDIVEISGRAADFEAKDNNLAFSTEQDSQVLHVTSDEAALSVSRDYDAFYQQDDFIFSLDLKSDVENGTSVFGIHNSFQLDVVDDDLVFSITTSEGQFEVATDNDILADRGWHEVQIAYSDSLGQLQISVDGEMAVDTAVVSGHTLERAYWGLTIGAQWGQGFEGEIDNFAFLSDPSIQSFDLM